ncbi:hypothetical protein [Kaarinaea lacus]
MSDKKLLKTRDFSKPAVQKAVALNTLEHPAVLYPTAISVLGGFAALLMGANPVFMMIAAGGVGAAFLSWAVNFGLRRDHFANQYVKKLHAQMESQRQARKQELEKVLAEVESEEGRSQFARVTDKFTTFQKMLSQKLNPSELTYGRYLGMAEQVYLGALDNLQRVADTLKMMRVIDLDYTHKRLQQLQSTTSKNSAKEIDTLEERLALHANQADKVQSLLSQNEEAMTKMDLTIAAIADMRTEDGRASMDMETAMNELQRLANKAKDYSIK